MDNYSEGKKSNSSYINCFYEDGNEFVICYNDGSSKRVYKNYDNYKDLISEMEDQIKYANDYKKLIDEEVKIETRTKFIIYTIMIIFGVIGVISLPIMAVLGKLSFLLAAVFLGFFYKEIRICNELYKMQDDVYKNILFYEEKENILKADISKVKGLRKAAKEYIMEDELCKKYGLDINTIDALIYKDIDKIVKSTKNEPKKLVLRRKDIDKK